MGYMKRWQAKYGTVVCEKAMCQYPDGACGSSFLLLLNRDTFDGTAQGEITIRLTRNRWLTLRLRDQLFPTNADAVRFDWEDLISLQHAVRRCNQAKHIGPCRAMPADLRCGCPFPLQSKAASRSGVKSPTCATGVVESVVLSCLRIQYPTFWVERLPKPLAINFSWIALGKSH